MTGIGETEEVGRAVVNGLDGVRAGRSAGGQGVTGVGRAVRDIDGDGRADHGRAAQDREGLRALVDRAGRTGHRGIERTVWPARLKVSRGAGGGGGRGRRADVSEWLVSVEPRKSAVPL